MENLLSELTAEIVAAYVSKNAIPSLELPDVIVSVYNALARVSDGAAQQDAEPQILTPAVSIKKSVTPEHIICLEDGKKFKSLKRHLSASYNLTPDEYRARWNLPSEYWHAH